MLIACVLLAAAAAVGEGAGRIEAATGAPVVDVSGGYPVRALERAAYEREAEGERFAIAADNDPWSGQADTLYGFVGNEWGRRVTFALRTTDDGGTLFLVDVNRNGDLRDESVITAEKVGEGRRARFRLSGPEVPLAITFHPEASPDRPRLFVSAGTLREGSVRIGEHDVKFLVTGTYGIYGQGAQSVYFDTDADGEIDLGRYSDERYLNLEGVVNLGGRSWSFATSDDGGRLTLEPLAEKRPDRARLAPGSKAPDFEFVDLRGEPGRLSDYRGRVVALYFWATWCGPCRLETPHLQEAWTRYRARGLEILAVAKEDDADIVREHVAANGFPWRQVVDPAGGPIASLYRASGIPLVLIVDREGVIVDRALHQAQITEGLAPQFAD